MAQHYDIRKYPQKVFRQIETSFHKRFQEDGAEKLKSSLRFILVEDERVMDHPDDLVFKTSRIVYDERELFEIHFNNKTKTITSIYLVK